MSGTEVRNEGQEDTTRDKSTRSHDPAHLPPMTPTFDFLGAQNPGSGPDLLHSFAPDLANLVMADYPFEMSVSDRNLLQASTDYMTDSYSAALFDLDTLNQVS